MCIPPGPTNLPTPNQLLHLQIRTNNTFHITLANKCSYGHFWPAVLWYSNSMPSTNRLKKKWCNGLQQLKQAKWTNYIHRVHTLILRIWDSEKARIPAKARWRSLSFLIYYLHVRHIFSWYKTANSWDLLYTRQDQQPLPVTSGTIMATSTPYINVTQTSLPVFPHDAWQAKSFCNTWCKTGYIHL